jgi:hypothetical protein
MDTPEDRWVSTVLLPDNEVNDLAHLKLIIGDSVSTSYGIIVRRPENGAA